MAFDASCAKPWPFRFRAGLAQVPFPAVSLVCQSMSWQGKIIALADHPPLQRLSQSLLNCSHLGLPGKVLQFVRVPFKVIQFHNRTGVLEQQTTVQLRELAVTVS